MVALFKKYYSTGSIGFFKSSGALNRMGFFSPVVKGSYSIGLSGVLESTGT